MAFWRHRFANDIAINHAQKKTEMIALSGIP
jgi:hypothetical protein